MGQLTICPAIVREVIVSARTRTDAIIIITYVVAFISYNAYEKNFLRLKRFFGGDQSQKPKIPDIQNAVVVQDGHCELTRNETAVSS